MLNRSPHRNGLLGGGRGNHLRVWHAAAHSLFRRVVLAGGYHRRSDFICEKNSIWDITNGGGVGGEETLVVAVEAGVVVPVIIVLVCTERSPLGVQYEMTASCSIVQRGEESMTSRHPSLCVGGG